jgi:hypothetical protein
VLADCRWRSLQAIKDAMNDMVCRDDPGSAA